MTAKDSSAIEIILLSKELLNSHPCKFSINSLSYNSVTHFYESRKFSHHCEHQFAIRFAPTAEIAEELGHSRTVPIRSDWHSVRVSVMKAGLEAKFSQNADLKEILLRTGKALLVLKEQPHERIFIGGGDDGGAFWSFVRFGNGRNMLGKLMMQIRSELQILQSSRASLTKSITIDSARNTEILTESDEEDMFGSDDSSGSEAAGNEGTDDDDVYNDQSATLYTNVIVRDVDDDFETIDAESFTEDDEIENVQPYSRCNQNTHQRHASEAGKREFAGNIKDEFETIQSELSFGTENDQDSEYEVQLIEKNYNQEKRDDEGSESNESANDVSVDAYQFDSNREISINSHDRSEMSTSSDGQQLVYSDSKTELLLTLDKMLEYITPDYARMLSVVLNLFEIVSCERHIHNEVDHLSNWAAILTTFPYLRRYVKFTPEKDTDTRKSKKRRNKSILSTSFEVPTVADNDTVPNLELATKNIISQLRPRSERLSRNFTTILISLHLHLGLDFDTLRKHITSDEAVVKLQKDILFNTLEEFSLFILENVFSQRPSKIWSVSSIMWERGRMLENVYYLSGGTTSAISDEISINESEVISDYLSTIYINNEETLDCVQLFARDSKFFEISNVESHNTFKPYNSTIEKFALWCADSFPSTLTDWLRICVVAIETMKSFEKFMNLKRLETHLVVCGNFRNELNKNRDASYARKTLECLEHFIYKFNSDCKSKKGKQMLMLSREEERDFKFLDVAIPRSAEKGLSDLSKCMKPKLKSVISFLDSSFAREMACVCFAWFYSNGGKGWLNETLPTETETIPTAKPLKIVSIQPKQVVKQVAHKSTLNECASKIQKAWKEYKERRRLKIEANQVKEKLAPAQIAVLDLNSSVNGPWHILLADKAQNALKRMMTNHRILTPVLKNLAAISEGKWYASVAKPLKYQLPVPVVEAKSNLRIVWQVDVGYSETISSYTQIIKVWNITDHAGVVKTLERLGQCQQIYSDEHRRRCKIRKWVENSVDDSEGQSNVAQLVRPEVFNDDGGISTIVARIPVKPQESIKDAKKVDLLMLHDMTVTAKFIPLSKLFVNFLLDGKQSLCEFPFALSEAEHDIIRHPGSVLVFGRSGTGKTTCSLFRLLSMYYVYHSTTYYPLYAQPSPLLQNETALNLRQVFVTASPILCARIKAYFGRLVKALEISSSGKELNAELFFKSISLAKGTPTNVKDRRDEIAELTKTVQRLLYDENAVIESEADDRLIGEDEEDAMLRSVPDSFLNLSDHHFPLFITYRKYVSMVRKALDLDKNESAIGMVDEEKASLENNLNYLHFVEKHWKRMPEYETNGIDPSLAFNEIMGIIKGSEAAAKSRKGFLSRDEVCVDLAMKNCSETSKYIIQYINLNDRSFSVFAHLRERMYDIFEIYQQRVAAEGDALDRVNEVNRCLETERIRDLPPIHELYIDEVQDLTMSQLLPLVRMCVQSNPDGLMFAGDTAQTISRGSVFRFQDLSSMIYRELESKGGEDLATKRKPRMFKLSRNYRSHDGILKLAASCLDLLDKYFPGCIDSMERDTGVVDGPKPICFVEKGIDEFLGLFGLVGGKTVTGESIEFGADQVILIRDASDEEDLRRRIGDGALILTTEQAKGMEFSDVLLYSPIAKSHAGNKWRVFMGQIKQNTERFPVFNGKQHNILATELKVLYTGITRARNRLWIFDENEEIRKPMFAYWNSLGLVEMAETEDLKSHSEYRAFAQKSTAAEWASQGRNLFERRQYQPALFCFKRELILDPKADPNKSKLCEAWLFRQRGLSMILEGKNRDGEKELEKAADLFVSLSPPKNEMAAKCFESANRFQRAGDLYLYLEKLHDAARCYELGHLYKDAGACYESLKMSDMALNMYKTGRLHLEAVRCVLNHPEDFDPKAEFRIKRLVFLDCGNATTESRILELCKDHEIVPILTSKGKYTELLEYYQTKEDYISAAEILHHNLELFDLAAAEYMKAESPELAAECLFYHAVRLPVLQLRGFVSGNVENSSVEERFVDASEALSMFVTNLNKLNGREAYLDYLAELVLLSSYYLTSNSAKLRNMAIDYKSKKRYDLEFVALECYLRVFQVNPENDMMYEVSRLEECVHILERWCSIVREVLSTIFYPNRNWNSDGVTSKMIHGIVNAHPLEDQPSQLVLKPSFFHNEIFNAMQVYSGDDLINEAESSTFECSENDFQHAIALWMTNNVVSCLRKMDLGLRTYRFWNRNNPRCIHFLYGTCADLECDYLHSTAPSFDQAFFLILECFGNSLDVGLHIVRILQRTEVSKFVPDAYTNVVRIQRRVTEKMVIELTGEGVIKPSLIFSIWDTLRPEIKNILKDLVLKVWIRRRELPASLAIVSSAFIFKRMKLNFPRTDLEDVAGGDMKLQDLVNWSGICLNPKVPVQKRVGNVYEITRFENFNISSSLLSLLESFCSLILLCSHTEVVLPQSFAIAAVDLHHSLEVSGPAISELRKHAIPSFKELLFESAKVEQKSLLRRLRIIRILALFEQYFPGNWSKVMEFLPSAFRTRYPLHFIQRMSDAAGDKLIYISGCQQYPARYPGKGYRDFVATFVKDTANFQVVKHRLSNGTGTPSGKIEDNLFVIALRNTEKLRSSGMNPAAKHFVPLKEVNPSVLWSAVVVSEKGGTPASNLEETKPEQNQPEDAAEMKAEDERKRRAANKLVIWMRERLAKLRINKEEIETKVELNPFALETESPSTESNILEKREAAWKIFQWMRRHVKRKLGPSYTESLEITRNWRSETSASGFVHVSSEELKVELKDELGDDLDLSLESEFDEKLKLVDLINESIGSCKSMKTVSFLVDKLLSLKEISPQISYRVLYMGEANRLCKNLEKDLNELRPLCRNARTRLEQRSQKSKKKKSVFSLHQMERALDVLDNLW
ncbi:hypothetical protein HK098_005091 [Nowakowskiella sp. JEL0407]|nr:hypothetical protein HK098_005091 [Nowakowskiella sp. JEL0407]